MLNLIWHLLPLEFRRKYGNLASDLLNRSKFKRDFQPFPCPNNQSKNIAILGYFSQPIGIGKSANLLSLLFLQNGFSIQNIDAKHLECGKYDANLLDEFDTIIFVINPDSLYKTCNQIGVNALFGKKLIAYCVWETTIAPENWALALNFFHEVWTPSNFSRSALERIISHKIKILPHPVALYKPQEPSIALEASIREALNIPTDCFVVFNSFSFASSFARKNLLDAIKSFKIAFPKDENCKFIIRHSSHESYPKSYDLLKNASIDDDRIILLPAKNSEIELYTWYEIADVYLSLHRSEGFGLNLAEAMLAKLPVIATNWSGNTDFMSKQDSILIGAVPFPIFDPDGIYKPQQGNWAKLNLEVAANELKNLFQNRQLVETIGSNASLKIANTLAKDCVDLNQFI